MGNNIGYSHENGIKLFLHPEVQPNPLEEPTFDPNLGFSNGRKERVMIATEEQLRSAKIKHKDRDYCAHLLLEYQACRKDNWPFPVKCQHEKHHYLNCQYDDFILRMKEYEREKRLRLRAKRLNQLEVS